MIKNSYRVPKKQWKYWNDLAKKVFNQVYSESYDNEGIFTHPKMDQIKQLHWKTISWNHAWIAADAITIFSKERNEYESKKCL